MLDTLKSSKRYQCLWILFLVRSWVFSMVTRIGPAFGPDGHENRRAKSIERRKRFVREEDEVAGDNSIKDMEMVLRRI